MNQTKKDIFTMMYSFVGSTLLFWFIVLNDFGMTSYAVKNIGETTIDILGFVSLGFFGLCIAYFVFVETREFVKWRRNLRRRK